MEFDETPKPTRRLKIDFGNLEMAFEDGSSEIDWYLDMKTGELDFVSDFLPSEDLDEVNRKLDEGSDRMLEVPAVRSRDGYRDMEDFIDTVSDERLRELLEVAIDGRGAFRRFKDVLARNEAEWTRWHAFKAERTRNRAMAWLEEEGIEPILE